jgi:5-hydroxyisourate hydrolase
MGVSHVTTHILDTSRGCPAAGIAVRLAVSGPDGWREIGSGVTDDDGRILDLGPDELVAGDYRIEVDAGAYHRGQDIDGFFTSVSVGFVLRDTAAHYHVPLLLSPFALSVYRGS